MARTPFTVEVLTPEGEAFNDEVEMLSTRTTVGSIGVLANHQPLLTMLDPTELRLHKSESEVLRFAQGEGFLQMSGTHALVLVDEVFPLDELDAGTVSDRLREAEERRDKAEADTEERRQAERDVRRYEAFTKLAGGSRRPPFGQFSRPAPAAPGLPSGACAASPCSRSCSACALAAPALAAPVHVLDPEDTPYGAPDVLDLVVDSNDAGELGVVTRFVPRPPAGWGVCVPFVPNSPTCFPPDMRVDWFFDFAPGAGAPSEGGADARVTAVPGAGTTTMELSRWAGARGWVTGAPPAFRTAPADPYLDLGWGTTLAELGIAPGTE